MSSRTLTLLSLIGLVVVIAIVTAAIMLSSTAYMNGAADFARAHLADLAAPDPMPGASPAAAPPVRVESLARYGDANAVEVQITRLYQTARHPEAQFTVTYFYQPVADGWLLVPPPLSYWGDQKTTTGNRVVIKHPLRMQRIATDLVTSIDAALTAACGQWQCADNQIVVNLTFTTDAAQSGQPGVYLAPELTGVPLSHDANDDFQSAFAAAAVRLEAAQLGKPSADGDAEVQRQKLYGAP